MGRWPPIGVSLSGAPLPSVGYVIAYMFILYAIAYIDIVYAEEYIDEIYEVAYGANLEVRT